MLFLKALLIPMLIKANLATRQPALCAFIYAAAMFTNALMFDVAFGAGWAPVLQKLAIITVVAFVVFWTLLKAEDYGPLYWLALFLGAAVLVIL